MCPILLWCWESFVTFLKCRIARQLLFHLGPKVFVQMRKGAMPNIMQESCQGYAQHVLIGDLEDRSVSCLQAFTHFLGQMSDANRMLESTMIRASIYQVRCSQLLNVTKSLDRPRIHDAMHQGAEINRAMNFIVVSQEHHGRVGPRLYQRLCPKLATRCDILASLFGSAVGLRCFLWGKEIQGGSFAVSPIIVV